MRLPTTLLVSFAGFLALSGCGGGSAIAVDTQRTYYLQYNLRAHGNKLTSINDWSYQTVLPVCSPAQIERARGREITFRVNGQRHRYIIHRSSRVDLATHVDRIFGPSCPDTRMMSQQDQIGIQAAQPVVGMTKAGVLVALGYPPDHVTPALQMSPWTYWGTRGQVALHFAGDVVASIEGPPDEPAVAQAGAVIVQPQYEPTAGSQVPPEQAYNPPPADEPTVVVTDAHGYPVAVPQSAVGRACDPQRPCHQALRCVPGAAPGTGTCQAAQ